MLFCASLFWTLAIVWTTQILARINLVTDSGQSAMSFFEIAALILPSIMPVVMPFAAIIAIAQTLTVMNTDSETGRDQRGRRLAHDADPPGDAARGARQHRLLRDRQRRRSLCPPARPRAGARPRAPTFCRWSSRRARSARSRTACSSRSASASPTGGSAASSSPIRAPKAPTSSTTPRSAMWSSEGNETMLIMQDGEIHRKLPGNDVSVIRFTSYAFDLSVFAASSGTATTVSEGPHALLPASIRSGRCDVQTEAAVVSRGVASAIHRMGCIPLFLL